MLAKLLARYFVAELTYSPAIRTYNYYWLTDLSPSQRLSCVNVSRPPLGFPGCAEIAGLLPHRIKR
jgi:hypothetical protein